MRYMGGKHYEARSISAFINEIREPGQPYWEPFVGAGSVATRIGGQGPNYFSDLHQGLILLLSAVARGWDPPEHVSQEAYDRAREGHGDPAWRAFVGFACSYGGRYFQGYARGQGTNYAKVSSRALRRKVRTMRRPRFFVADFLGPPLDLDRRRPWLIYCDPPYSSSTPYNGLPEFDNEAFWEQARRLGDQGHLVIVSEYQAPEDFTQLARLRRGRRLGPDRPEIADRLFCYDPHGEWRPRESAQLSLWA